MFGIAVVCVLLNVMKVMQQFLRAKGKNQNLEGTKHL